MTQPNRDLRSSVGAADRPQPLTNPADLITLLGRFMACFVLFVLTIAAFVTRHLLMGIGLGVVSLLWQRAATGLWRRLRDERIVAEAARVDETAGVNPL